MLYNSQERYGLISKLLHWIMAATILSMIGLGSYMTDLDKTDPMRAQLYGLHKSIGVTLLILAVIRLLWIITSPPPPHPRALQKFEVIIAKSVMGLLYLLMFTVPIVGYLMSNAFGKPVNYFGFVELPQLIAQSPSIAEILSAIHGPLAYLMLGLVTLHLAGALKHRFLSNNPETDVLKRML